jgi:phosphoserine phosphatase
MVQIVLIRPGTSEFDEQGRIQGNLDIPLSERGQREVQQSIGELKCLKLSVIYSSPCEAAWQTASTIAAELGIKAKQLDTLQNLDHGLWQGMLIDEVKRKQPKVFRQWQEHPEMVCPPEGEMFSDCRERVEAAFAKLQKKHREGAIGIVAPEPLASIIHCVVTHCASADAGKVKSHGAAWEVLGENVRSLQFRGCEILVPRGGNGHEATTVNGHSPANGTENNPLIVPKNAENAGSILPPSSLESRS